jgi:hypothetical protein
MPGARALPEIELLAAFCYVTGNLPASILDKSSDLFLREVSTIALVLCNFSTGSFDPEFASQLEDFATFRSL